MNHVFTCNSLLNIHLVNFQWKACYGLGATKYTLFCPLKRTLLDLNHSVLCSWTRFYFFLSKSMLLCHFCSAMYCNWDRCWCNFDSEFLGYGTSTRLNFMIFYFSWLWFVCFVVHTFFVGFPGFVWLGFNRVLVFLVVGFGLMSFLVGFWFVFTC